MKKFLKWFGIFLLVLVLAAGGLCIWQWNNLTALRAAQTHSKEDLNQMIEDNNKRVEEASQKVEGVTVRELTPEEMQALYEKRTSREEIIAAISKEAVEPETEPEAPAAPPVDPKKEQLSAYLAEIYVMKAEYTQWLDQVYEKAIADFTALPPEEQTADSKIAIGMVYLKDALEKEKECDQKMKEMEQKIYDLLVEMGEDTSMVDDIQAAYEEEKQLKKAYYLSGKIG